LIFSTPCSAASSSQAAKTWSSAATTSAAGRRSESGVKPTRSANSTVTSSWSSSAMTASDSFRRAATGSGSTLRSRRSDLACSRSRSRMKYWSRTNAVPATETIVSAKKARTTP